MRASLILTIVVSIGWVPDWASAYTCTELLTALKVSRLQIRKHAQSHGGDRWAVDSANEVHGGGKYDYSFVDLLGPYKALNEFAKHRLARGKTMNYLDLFGSANTIDLNNLTSATGARLLAWNEDRARYRPDASKRQKYNVVSGDLFDHTTDDIYSLRPKPSTWSKLLDNLHERNIQSIDLVTIRPVGGLSDIDGSFGFHLNFMILLRRAYRLLSNDGGVMLIQMPDYGASERLYEPWAKRLRKAGVGAKAVLTRSGYYVMRIEKNLSSPVILPL